MSKFDEFYKFNITETVKSKVQRPDGCPNLLHVVSRTMDECPGGVQFHYHCRQHFIDLGVSVKLVPFNEIELEACDFEEELRLHAEREVKRERDNYRVLRKMRMEVDEQLKAEKDKLKEE